MKQARKTEKWADRVWVPGTVDTIDLPIGLDLESIHIYLLGNINVTTAYTGIRSEGMAKLIDKIELVKDGRVVGTTTFSIASHGNYQRHMTPIKLNPGVGIGNYIGVEAVGFIDLASIGCIRPKDSNLVTKGARSLQLRIKYATLGDMFIGAGAATPALNVSVSVRRTDETDHGKLPEFLHKHFFDEKSYAANTSDRIALPIDILTRSIVLRAESAGELSANVITNVRVEVGGEVWLNLPAAVLTDHNSCDNDGLTLPNGYYVVDFSPEPSGLSKFSDFLSTVGRNDAYLTLDVVGGATNKVQFLHHQYEALHDHINANAATA